VGRLRLLIVALTRLRRAARLAAGIPQLQASLDGALAQFNRDLPDLKKMRDVAEHIDDYALNQGRQKAIVRQSLEVSTMKAEGDAVLAPRKTDRAGRLPSESSPVCGRQGSLASTPRRLTDVTTTSHSRSGRLRR
jgi:hypothetical protein